MLNSCRPLLVTRRAMKYGTKLKQRFRNPSRIPITQTNQQRRETIQQILRTRRVNPGRESEYFYVEKKLFSRTARLDREDGNVNNVFALQGLGDLEPLRNSANFGLSEREMLKFDSPADIAKHSPPPIPFTPLAARKLADGKLWPAATEPTGMMSKEVRLLRHESNMSPSARAFGEKVAFHLRRSLRACPGHIGERIDFAQLVIQEVVASRRSKQIYIVWSTVDPGARFELEPLLHRLNYWVQRLIVNRIKTRPHIPHVNWIYDGGRLERELPRDLKTELTSLVGETRSTLEERVKYLKELDTINQRMKNIPWFMPYLWNKDDKARRQKLMETDLETMESRQAAVGGGSRSGRGSAQSSYTVDRGSPSQTSPPPTFVSCDREAPAPRFAALVSRNPRLYVSTLCTPQHQSSSPACDVDVPSERRGDMTTSAVRRDGEEGERIHTAQPPPPRLLHPSHGYATHLRHLVREAPSGRQPARGPNPVTQHRRRTAGSVTAVSSGLQKLPPSLSDGNGRTRVEVGEQLGRHVSCLRRLRETGAAVLNDAPLTSFLEPFDVSTQYVVGSIDENFTTLFCTRSDGEDVSVATNRSHGRASQGVSSEFDASADCFDERRFLMRTLRDEVEAPLASRPGTALARSTVSEWRPFGDLSVAGESECPRLSASPTCSELSEQGAHAVVGTPSSGISRTSSAPAWVREEAAIMELVAPMIVPRWKCFSTVAALLVALADSGIIDEFIPVHSVRYVDWTQLVQAQQAQRPLNSPFTPLPRQAAGAAALRIPHPPPRRVAARPAFGEDSTGRSGDDSHFVPVAIMIPLPAKGTIYLRRGMQCSESVARTEAARAPHLAASFSALSSSGGRYRRVVSMRANVSMTLVPPSQQSAGGGDQMVRELAKSITVAPFSDAELFQLFYIQLILRAAYDIRYTGMEAHITAVGASRAVTSLRGDKIGYRLSGPHSLMFEHPQDSGRAIMFPARSRILSLRNLDEWVVPIYATRESLWQTRKQRLLGTSTSAALPCVSTFGRKVVDGWASRKVIDGPATAFEALVELFNVFSERYHAPCDRADHTAVKPLLFRCSEKVAFRALREGNGDILRFLSDFAQVAGVRAAEAAAAQPAHPFPAFSVLDPDVPMPDMTCPSSSERVRFPPSAAPFDGTPDTHLAENVTRGALPADSSLRVEALGSPADDAAAGACELGPLSLSEMPFGVPAYSTVAKQESLVTRWRQYVQVGMISLFNGTTDGIELLHFLGKGGSGVVFKGLYGRDQTPVAVKCFVHRDGFSHEEYVRESLTDVAFFALFNQLGDHGIAYGARAHDFIICDMPPKGMSDEDVHFCRLKPKDGVKPPEDAARLCYLVTDLMDGTMGRFLNEEDEDFDPMYDMLVNSPMCDGEFFQFLYIQLVVRALFDYSIHDVMLNGQLRGDNVGFRLMRQRPAAVLQSASSGEDPEACGGGQRRDSLQPVDAMQGLIVEFQTASDDKLRYLQFPGDQTHKGGTGLRMIYFIDLGQGIQPSAQQLTEKGYIGKTVVESCVVDDGMGRYWPPDELYCRYIDVEGAVADEAQRWGASKKIRSPQDAELALRELLELYSAQYSVDEPSDEARASSAVCSWTTTALENLKRSYVYR